MMNMESIGEGIDGGDSMEVGSKVLSALPLVVDTTEENHDRKGATGASETTAAMMPPTEESSRQG